MSYWLNFDTYPAHQLIPFVVGCFLWVIVYAIYVKQIWKDKFVEMPFIAAYSNFAWEWLWGYAGYWNEAFRPDMGMVVWIGYRAWAILDIYIIYGVFKYADWQIATPAIRKHYKLISVLVCAFWFLVYYRFTSEGHDTTIGANSAYVAQILISIYYVVMIAQAKSVKKFSYAVVWLRTLGSGLTTSLMIMHYPASQHGFLLSLAGSALILDCYCIWLFTKKRRAERLTA